MAENTAGGKKAVYEGMFIFDANRLARDSEGLPREVAALIESVGGQLEVSRLWEERRLAYPIKGQRNGAYWITYFRLATSQLAELTKQCEFKEGILRQLFVRLPESLVEPILQHAKGEGISRSDESADAEPDSKPAPAAAVTELTAS